MDNRRVSLRTGLPGHPVGPVGGGVHGVPLWWMVSSVSVAAAPPDAWPPPCLQPSASSRPSTVCGCLGAAGPRDPAGRACRGREQAALRGGREGALTGPQAQVVFSRKLSSAF